MADRMNPQSRQPLPSKLNAQSTQAQRRRHPLSETTHWVNNQASLSPSPSLSVNGIPSSSPQPGLPQPGLPHHTSLAPGGILQAQDNAHLSPNKVDNKRVSAVSSEEARKRDSQSSTASTNASGKSRTKRAVGPWRLGATIGKGATGRVRKARHEFTGQDAAIKIISKKSAEMFKSASIMNMDNKIPGSGNGGARTIPFGIERECVIMKLIDHPNIISLYDMWENRGEL